MTRLAANLTMMFTDLPFLDRFAAAAGAGFAAVEFVSPYAEAPEAVAGVPGASAAPSIRSIR